ncbi:MAG TPA: carboxypeptidase regulatory-like domain-containing protein, partial [Pyrinomonadaceae bacterium]|nr:carboxypeptidase regulatory-like domain-containing protein [Pyrinomonadaceae bacterium]
MTCHRAFRFLPGARCLLPTVFLLLTVHCSLLTVTAQSTSATLSGTVEDTQGAVVPNVTVAVLNLDTSLQRQTITDESGSYVFVFLPPGRYRVTAEGKGFAKVQIEDVVLNVGDQKALQIQLKAGDITEMVKITGEAPLINESPAVATTIDRQFVSNLPLNGRTFQSLIALTPGVVFGNFGTNVSDSFGFSVNGQRPTANYFTVDGVSANVGSTTVTAMGTHAGGTSPAVTASGGTQALVPLDAMQEFNIQTSTYSARFGRQPGGQV